MEKLRTMNLKMFKPKKDELVFYACYTLYLIISILYTSMYSVYFVFVYRYLLYVIIVALFFNECAIGRYSVKAMIISMAIAALSCLVFWTVKGSVYIVCLMVFIVCSKNIQFDDIAKYTIAVSSALVIFVVASSLLGVIENYHMFIQNRHRYFLGFRYALYLPTYLYNITSLYIYVHRKNLKVPNLIVVALINYVVYLQTRSRLSFVLTILLVVVALIIKMMPAFVAKRKMLFRLMIGSFWFWFAVSLWLTITYKSSVPWMRELNAFLSNRLSLGQKALLLYGVHPLGQTIEWVGMGLDSSVQRYAGTYNYVDCLYVKILIQYGILFTVFYLSLYTFTAYRCYKSKQYCLLILLAFISMRVVIEDLSLLLHYNTVWFAVGMILKGSLKCGKDTNYTVPDYIDENRISAKQRKKLKLEMI